MSTSGMEEIEDILDPPFDVPVEVAPSLADLLPRGYLSVSQMVLFLKCAYSWYLRYVERQPTRTSARMFQGIQVHRAVEMVLAAKLETGRLPPLELALDTFSTAFDKQKPLIEDWEGEDPGLVKDTGIVCTKVHYRDAAPAATPIMVEKTFYAKVSSPDGKVHLPVFGRIDSIQVQTNSDDEYQAIRQQVLPLLKAQQAKKVKLPVLPAVSKPLRLHDAKVVTDKWSDADLKNDLQFAIYAGVEHIPDVQVDELVKGRAKVPRPRYEALRGVMTAVDVRHAERVAAGVARSIAMGHFPPTDPGNWWCSERWCSMWGHCRGLAKAA